MIFLSEARPTGALNKPFLLILFSYGLEQRRNLRASQRLRLKLIKYNASVSRIIASREKRSAARANGARIQPLIIATNLARFRKVVGSFAAQPRVLRVPSRRR